MIFDDVAEIMNRETPHCMSEKTGLSRNKVKRLSHGIPFILDYNTVFALQRLGYEIKLEKKEK